MFCIATISLATKAFGWNVLDSQLFSSVGGSFFRLPADAYYKTDYHSVAGISDLRIVADSHCESDSTARHFSVYVYMYKHKAYNNLLLGCSVMCACCCCCYFGLGTKNFSERSPHRNAPLMWNLKEFKMDVNIHSTLRHYQAFHEFFFLSLSLSSNYVSSTR